MQWVSLSIELLRGHNGDCHKQLQYTVCVYLLHIDCHKKMQPSCISAWLGLSHAAYNSKSLHYLQQEALLAAGGTACSRRHCLQQEALLAAGGTACSRRHCLQQEALLAAGGTACSRRHCLQQEALLAAGGTACSRRHCLQQEALLAAGGTACSRRHCLQQEALLAAGGTACSRRHCLQQEALLAAGGTACSRRHCLQQEGDVVPNPPVLGSSSVRCVGSITKACYPQVATHSHSLLAKLIVAHWEVPHTIWQGSDRCYVHSLTCTIYSTCTNSINDQWKGRAMLHTSLQLQAIGLF